MRLDMTFSVKSMGRASYFTEYRDLPTSQKTFNPYTHYEKTKLKNFQESSRLEGIQIEYPQVETSLEDILDKYRS